MKSNVLKSIVAVGLVGLFTMAGTASASDDYYYSESDDYCHFESHSYGHDDDQVHTYHAAEHPFIW